MVDSLEEFIREKPNFQVLRRYFYEILIFKKEYTSALKLAEKMVTTNPKSIDNRLLLIKAITYIHKDSNQINTMLEEVFTEIRKSITIDRIRINWYYKQLLVLSNLYAKLDDPELKSKLVPIIEFILTFEDILKPIDAVLVLAEYYKERDIEKAKKFYHIVLGYNTTNFKAKEGLKKLESSITNDDDEIKKELFYFIAPKRINELIGSESTATGTINLEEQSLATIIDSIIQEDEKFKQFLELCFKRLKIILFNFHEKRKHGLHLDGEERRREREGLYKKLSHVLKKFPERTINILLELYNSNEEINIDDLAVYEVIVLTSTKSHAPIFNNKFESFINSKKISYYFNLLELFGDKTSLEKMVAYFIKQLDNYIFEGKEALKISPPLTQAIRKLGSQYSIEISTEKNNSLKSVVKKIITDNTLDERIRLTVMDYLLFSNDESYKQELKELTKEEIPKRDSLVELFEVASKTSNYNIPMRAREILASQGESEYIVYFYEKMIEENKSHSLPSSIKNILRDSKNANDFIIEIVSLIENEKNLLKIRKLTKYVAYQYQTTFLKDELELERKMRLFYLKILNKTKGNVHILETNMKMSMSLTLLFKGLETNNYRELRNELDDYLLTFMDDLEGFMEKKQGGLEEELLRITKKLVERN